MPANVDLPLLELTFRLHAVAVSCDLQARKAPLPALDRLHHYRAVERSWRATEEFRATMLAETGHARHVVLWSLARASAALFDDAASQVRFA